MTVIHTAIMLRRALRLASLLFLIVATPGVGAAQADDVPLRWWLQVVQADGEPLVSVPMPPSAGWCMAWNHSVEGFTVNDCYRNRNGRMVLERSHLPDFAAGLDHIPGRGWQRSDGHGGYWIEDIDEPVPGNRYRLRVGGPAVNHRLISRGVPELETLVQRARQRGLPVQLPGSGDADMTPISLSDTAADRAVTVQLIERDPADP